MDSTLVAELIYRQWSGGDPSADSGLELQDFEVAVKQARAYKISKDYTDIYNKSLDLSICQGWLREYKNIDVILDEETNTYYSVLPATVLDLPHGLGLYHVSAMKDFQNPFKPQTIGESYLFQGNPQDNITFHFDTNNIYFDNFDPAIKKIYLQLIPLIDQDIPDEFIFEVSELVLNRYLKSAPISEDKIDNNNPNIKEVSGGKQ